MTKHEFLTRLNAYLNFNCSRSANRIYAYLTRIGKAALQSYKLGDAEKEDVVAESVNTAFKKFSYYDSKYSVSTWFGTIVKNKAIDLLRKNKSAYGSAVIRSIDSFYVNENSDGEALQVADVFCCPANRMTNDFLLDLIYERIESMSQGDKKTILREYFIEEKPNADIIRDHGFRKEFVNVTVFRFKESLKREFQVQEAA